MAVSYERGTHVCTPQKLRLSRDDVEREREKESARARERKRETERDREAPLHPLFSDLDGPVPLFIRFSRFRAKRKNLKRL